MKKIILIMLILSACGTKVRHCGKIIEKYTSRGGEDGNHRTFYMVLDSAGKRIPWNADEEDFINTDIGDNVCIYK